ncbi:murein hydrolase activator EnvC family protein [Mycetocola zhujimingii]|uniref:M23ase beta-sheet core domain-containing protein n=1 Tax=Mycetocola zhujimingii TaxID=2079792 RepID=A0A2U1TH94_9MICO|nr:M23 family metallopeptidase [Mycetocola zhujimingii]PWC08264.1 hypothetical protein DF223_02665 [Mycetocola zhujimingii]
MTGRSSRLYGLALAGCCVAVILAAPSAAAAPASTVRFAEAPPPAASGAGSWLWPVSAAPAVIRQFEAPATRYAAGHRGIDLTAPGGTPVVAPADGLVSFSGTVVDRPVLSITYPGGLVSSIEPVIGTVAEGDQVLAGTVIGSVASGGHCSDSCAHFGVRLHGEYVNPLALLESLQRAVLLPLEG